MAEKHGKDCNCSTCCCYPQRPMPPKSEVTTAKDKPGCAKECAKKQVGDSGNII